MKKETKKILAGIGAVSTVAAAAAAFHRFTVNYLMKLAVDRHPPKSFGKSQNKMMGSEELAAMVTAAAIASKELEQMPHETVSITSFDGTELVGHWYQNEAPHRIVIAMHGWRSCWSNDFGPISEFLLEQGCSILFAEQRGQGNSSGDYMGFGLTERYDCLDWIRWVNERCKGSLPIYLAGVSMGATTVLMTAGFELPENVRGIVADCGFTSPHAIWEHVVESNFHIPYGIYRAAADDLCRKKIRVDADSYSTTEALMASSVPILFIHGSDDHFVPIEMTYENYKACASPKELFIVPGAEHAVSYLMDKLGYENAVLSFWEKYDNQSRSNCENA